MKCKHLVKIGKKFKQPLYYREHSSYNDIIIVDGWEEEKIEEVFNDKRYRFPARENYEVCGGELKFYQEAILSGYDDNNYSELETGFRCQRCFSTQHPLLPSDWRVEEFVNYMISQLPDDFDYSKIKRS